MLIIYFIFFINFFKYILYCYYLNVTLSANKKMFVFKENGMNINKKK